MLTRQNRKGNIEPSSPKFCSPPRTLTFHQHCTSPTPPVLGPSYTSLAQFFIEAVEEPPLSDPPSSPRRVVAIRSHGARRRHRRRPVPHPHRCRGGGRVGGPAKRCGHEEDEE